MKYVIEFDLWDRWSEEFLNYMENYEEDNMDYNKIYDIAMKEIEGKWRDAKENDITAGTIYPDGAKLEKIEYKGKGVYHITFEAPKGAFKCDWTIVKEVM